MARRASETNCNIGGGSGGGGDGSGGEEPGGQTGGGGNAGLPEGNTTADGTADASQYQMLKQDLSFQEASSIFTDGGELQLPPTVVQILRGP